LLLALETIQNYTKRDQEVIPLLVLVSDGKANVHLKGEDPVEEAKAVAREIKSAGITSIGIDTEQDFIRFGLVEQICHEMGGECLQLEELSPAPLASAVRDHLSPARHLKPDSD
ncbi:MAG: magnesium chelatase, partial [Thermoproteota archaeon]